MSAPVPGRDIVDGLLRLEVSHVVTVPDTSLRTVIDLLEAGAGPRVVRATTEDDVLAVCAGLWMAGRRPLALIQQLGLFAAVNALRAFTHDQRVPLAILAGLYGRDVGRPPDDDAQPSAVRLCGPLLETLGVEWSLAEGPEDLPLAMKTLARGLDGPAVAVALFGAPTS